jgi:hypothetical protein
VAALFAIILVQAYSPELAAQQVGPIQASGDPQALAVTESALKALSGTSNWLNVEAAHLAGTMSVPGKDGPTTFTVEWEDIWQQGNIWSLHKMTTGNSEQDLIQSPGEARSLRREDKSIARVGGGMILPPVEIPGAFLAEVLADTRCSVKNMDTSQTQTTNDGAVDIVRIRCDDTGAPGDVEPQFWAFDHSTHVPSFVNITRADMRHAGARFNEVVHFEHYRIVQGLLIPDICVLTQGGLTRTVTLQRIAFPDPSQFPKSDFEVSK